MPTYEEAWTQLLETPSYDPAASCNLVNASDMKRLGVEPRLMTKHDTRAARPQPLRDRGLFLLPATNGSYHVLREDGYFDLRPHGQDHPRTFVAQYPFRIETLEGTQSEMSHLDRLYLTGVIADFLEESGPLYATVRGRRFSPTFTYFVGDLGPLSARGVQYEVDQGYESADEIALFEAKTSGASNFLVRQLYFPFRALAMRTTKHIRSVFLSYSDETGVYSMYEYRFVDPLQYRSIELARQAHYRLASKPATERPLGAFLAETMPRRPAEEPWEMPQADDVGKIARFATQVAKGYDHPDAIAAVFDFDRRQSLYYRKAAEQFGLICPGAPPYALSDMGLQFITMRTSEQVEYLVRVIVSLPIVRASLDHATAHTGTLTVRDIEQLALQHSSIRGDTAQRRARTVMAWIRWVERVLGKLEVNGRRLSL